MTLGYSSSIHNQIHLIRISLACFAITKMSFTNPVTVTRAQLNQTLISTTVTSNFIIVNKTSASKPQLILNNTFCMKDNKSDWFVISEVEIC